MSMFPAEPLHLLCLGVNYRTTAVAERERFSVSASQLPGALAELRAVPGVAECVLLSTCNRVELYCWTPDPERTAEALFEDFLRRRSASGRLRAFFDRREDAAALVHLARVAAGLDSLVLGETEIFGQLKTAYAAALEAGTTARCANRTFQKVFSMAKKVRSSTRITSGPTSVGAAAVQMAQDILGSLQGRNILVVGAGEVARTTAQSLHSRGAESIFVANRSYDRAQALAEEVGGRVIRFAEWVPYLEHIDIVIVSTASPAYVVAPPVLERVQRVRQRPLFLIDLSVPRNVDPACAGVEQVSVYNMDAMEAATEATRASRRAASGLAEQMIVDWAGTEAAELLPTDCSATKLLADPAML
ncbi:MAG: glutamyl-tRNA reductase [Akkermansia sp.]